MTRLRHVLAVLFRRNPLWFDVGPSRTELMRGLSMSAVHQKVVRPVSSARVERYQMGATCPLNVVRRDNVRKMR